MPKLFGTSRLGALVLVLVVLVGCGLAPEGEVPARFALVRVGGASVPAAVYQETVVPPEGGDPWLLELVVVEGALVLHPNGTYEHRLTHETFQDGRLVGRQRWTDRGVWSGSAEALVFTSTLVAGHGFTGVGATGERTLAFNLDIFVGTSTPVELVHLEGGHSAPGARPRQAVTAPAGTGSDRSAAARLRCGGCMR